MRSETFDWFILEFAAVLLSGIFVLRIAQTLLFSSFILRMWFSWEIQNQRKAARISYETSIFFRCHMRR